MLDLWWIALPALVAVALIAVVAWRGRRVAPLPLASAATPQDVAQRTARIRAVLVLLIGGALGMAYVTAPRPTGELSALVSSGQPTVIVLDMSQSVSDLVYSEIARTLEGIVTAAGDGRLGLVLFSDDAEEALPPGSRAVELAPFIRYFKPRHERGVATKPIYYRVSGPTEQAATQYPLSPWFGRFSGGTQISKGLRAAREALERDGTGGRAILLSDLGVAEEDIEPLAHELLRWEENDELELKVVALPPATPDRKAVFERVTGDSDLAVDSLSLATGTASARDPTANLSWPFVGVIVALAMLLGVHEARVFPMPWRPAERARS